MEYSSCVNCGHTEPDWNPARKYCSRKCKSAYRKAHPTNTSEHTCRTCGTKFPIDPGQYNKWFCSDECRKASIAKSVREFHLRHPGRETEYRNRTKEKRLPDSNLVRFRRNNPGAPTECESCGEPRVLDVAHKPNHKRNGAWRNAQNCKWPEMVWVLCPTCHALIDRMHYPPEELGLSI